MIFIIEKASKLSTIEKWEELKKIKDKEFEEIVKDFQAEVPKPFTLGSDKKSLNQKKEKLHEFTPEIMQNDEDIQDSPRMAINNLLEQQNTDNKVGTPLKDESSKGHHEIVSMLSNPNMLFNDASSIKYSIDNQNISNFSIPSITAEVVKAKFDTLDGMWYDLISAFVGDKYPTFIFVNKQVCSTFLDFQLEINDEVLNALAERVNQSQAYSLSSLSQVDPGKTKDAMKKLKAKKTIFSLSDTWHEKFCEAIQLDIVKLMEILSNYSLKQKDIVILKLYFSFMGRKYSGKHDNLFMRQTHRFLYENRHDIEDALDPILHFKFTNEVIVQVKTLLVSFLNQSFVDSEISDLSLFDAFTAIIIEALQYWDLIPAPEENAEVKEVKQQIDLIQKMKNHLSKIKAIIQ